MKTKLTETKFKSAIGRAGQLFSRIACLGAIILICSGASAQNLFVSANDNAGGVILKFTWDGVQSTFVKGLTHPWDLAFDNAGNLFVVDQDTSGAVGEAVIYKVTPNGARTTFASGLSYPLDLAVNRYGDVFVADYNKGIIYIYKPNGARITFASGLHHPVGLVFNTAGNLFVANNSAGNVSQGSIYEYKPDGSRATIAALAATDRPADLAFDSMGNLFMADLGGNIYKYDLSTLSRNARTIFGSVPASAQSLAFDSAGNLLVVDAGGVGRGAVSANAIYEFTALGTRSTFASGPALSESFACLAFQPMSPAPTPRPQPTPLPRPKPRPTPLTPPTPP